MLHTANRCMRPRLWPFVQLFLLIGCFLPLGCGSEKEQPKKEHPKQERPVREHLVSVKLAGGTGTQNVMCCSVQRGEIFARIREEEAEEAGKDHYEFPVFDGELLMVELSAKADKSTDKISFPYIFRGDEKMPLVFSRRLGLALLDGKVICVDLTDKAGAKWIERQPDAQLKTVRTLLLGGGIATDTAALTRMAGSGITIGFSSKSENESTAEPEPTDKVEVEAEPTDKAEAEARRALIAARPACLFTDREGLGKDTIAQLSDLTHLVIPSHETPDLTKLKKLRFFGCFDRMETLPPLTKLSHLQGLVLTDCNNVTDFTPLRKLTRLRTLHIGDADELADLDVFADMRDLRSLTLDLGGGSEIKSIAPIGKLTNLTELAIVRMPPTVKDLSPLKKLKNLKILVVDKDGLEKRQKEYDEIRKALPECKVVGYCMGSAWILLVVPAAVWLGVRRRRRSAAGKAA